ncbi:hypothetical protein CEXT_468251 [Caerostris extrusa]|uniref:Uncharacterized protein n=1 Tax=Caerostris extrusa TaxID=172846 RepID=A0AAV4MT85_CAEEX|nr:hypothetical protein CEXT_468251 [Caerostris extrusa]
MTTNLNAAALTPAREKASYRPSTIDKKEIVDDVGIFSILILDSCAKTAWIDSNEHVCLLLKARLFEETGFWQP